MGLGVAQIQPAQRFGAGDRIQADQLAHAQAGAIQQFHQQRVTQFLPAGLVASRSRRLVKIRQLHRRIHRQRLGQRLGGLGRTHAFHRVVRDQALLHQPVVEAAPAGQDQRNATRAAALAVHAGDPAANVGRLHLRQGLTGFCCEGLQLVQILGVERQGARRQTFLEADEIQIAQHQRIRGRLCGIGLRGILRRGHASLRSSGRSCRPPDG